MTLESFILWKKRKIEEKKAAKQREEDKKRKDFNAGKQIGLSGREMFSFNPEMALDNDMEEGDVAFDSSIYARDDDDEDFSYKELDLNALSLAAQEVDGSGTVADQDRLEKIKETVEEEAAATTSSADVVDATPFNENLFLEEDLEGLDEELNDLDLDDDGDEVSQS